jgi:hypothetical protein
MHMCVYTYEYTRAHTHTYMYRFFECITISCTFTGYTIEAARMHCRHDNAFASQHRKAAQSSRSRLHTQKDVKAVTAAPNILGHLSGKENSPHMTPLDFCMHSV